MSAWVSSVYTVASREVVNGVWESGLPGISLTRIPNMMRHEAESSNLITVMFP